ncbi:MAG: acetate--CoA ligase family protein, partial [Actinobacteria bacterium]|nr:acetate--CoA ligase family protein [Actinomycetota bacterium]
AIDPAAAARLRAAGVPVLEGTRTGLRALRHLLDHAAGPGSSAGPGSHAGPVSPAGPGSPTGPVSAAGSAGPGGAGSRLAGRAGPGRRRRWAAAIARGELGGAGLPGLLHDYGIPAAAARPAANREQVLAAAGELGYPVVLKTGAPDVSHKSDSGGVVLGLASPQALAAAYDSMSARLGPLALVCETVPAGTELALGLVRDPALGPLLVVGAGGVLAELLADRVVALPPVDQAGAVRMLGRLRVSALLAGARGQPAADLAAVAGAITGLSALATELGDELAALDINPLICGPSGAVAVDALAIPRRQP